jgi:hypothetical protein
LAEHGRAQIARRCCDGATRPKCYFFKSAAIGTQRPFVFRTTIDVVEYNAWKLAFRRAS